MLILTAKSEPTTMAAYSKKQGFVAEQKQGILTSQN